MAHREGLAARTRHADAEVPRVGLGQRGDVVGDLATGLAGEAPVGRLDSARTASRAGSEPVET